MNEKPTYADSTTFQRNIGEFTDRVHGGETVVVTAHGRPRMVLLSPKEYDALMADRREYRMLRLARLTEQTEPQQATR